jgi:hypothetical protein
VFCISDKSIEFTGQSFRIRLLSASQAGIVRVVEHPVPDRTNPDTTFPYQPGAGRHRRSEVF